VATPEHLVGRFGAAFALSLAGVPRVAIVGAAIAAQLAKHRAGEPPDPPDWYAVAAWLAGSLAGRQFGGGKLTSKRLVKSRR
jgi:hypothetical protein